MMEHHLGLSQLRRRYVVGLVLMALGYLALHVVLHMRPMTNFATGGLSIAAYPSTVLADSLISLGHTRTAMAAAMLFSFSLLGVGYVLIGQGIKRGETVGPSGAGLVLGLFTIVALLSLTPAMLSGDVHSYIFYGRMAGIHGVNPLVALPSELSGDPHYSYVYWVDTVSVYGPAWIWLSSVLTLLVNFFTDTHAVYVSGYKVVAIVAHLACIVIAGKIGERHGPARARFYQVMIAANPLLLIESSVSGHNDSLLLAFLLAAYLAHLRRRHLWVGLCLATAICIKMYALPFLGLYSVYLLVHHVRDKRELMAFFGSAISVTVVLYATCWSGAETLWHWASGPSTTWQINSIWTLVEHLSGSYGATHRAVALALVLVFAIVAVVMVIRGSDPFRAGCTFCFLQLVVASPWIWPWNFSLFVALAIVGTSAALRRSAIALSITGLMLYPSMIYDPAKAWLFIPIYGIPVLVYALTHLSKRRAAGVSG